MRFSEHEKGRIKKILESYAERTIPPHVRDEIRLEHRIHGDRVTLYERRPPWDGHGEWSATPVAQFRWSPAAPEWSLHWADRNGRWHPYEGFDSAAELDELAVRSGSRSDRNLLGMTVRTELSVEGIHLGSD